MANSLKGEIKEKIGDVEYTLRPTMSALMEIEDAIQKPVLDIVTGLKFEDGSPVKVGLTARQIIAIIFEGSKAAGNNLDREDLLKEIEKHGIGKFTHLAISFCILAMTGSESDTGKENGAEKA